MTDMVPASLATGTCAGLLLMGLAVFGVWITARIVGRAGFSPWWAALILLPVVNLIMIYVFAFARWPILKHHRAIGGGQAGPINRKA